VTPLMNFRSGAETVFSVIRVGEMTKAEQDNNTLFFADLNTANTCHSHFGLSLWRRGKC